MTTDSLGTIFQDCWPREWYDFQWTLCRVWPRLSGQGILLQWRHDEYEAKLGDGRQAELWWKCYMCNFIQVPCVSGAPYEEARTVNAQTWTTLLHHLAISCFPRLKSRNTRPLNILKCAWRTYGNLHLALSPNVKTSLLYPQLPISAFKSLGWNVLQPSPWPG